MITDETVTFVFGAGQSGPSARAARFICFDAFLCPVRRVIEPDRLAFRQKPWFGGDATLSLTSHEKTPLLLGRDRPDRFDFRSIGIRGVEGKRKDVSR